MNHFVSRNIFTSISNGKENVSFECIATELCVEGVWIWNRSKEGIEKTSDKNHCTSQDHFIGWAWNVEVQQKHQWDE